MSTGKHSVIFMGTPDFAVPSLRLLAENQNIDIAAVVTQADKPARRGQKLQSPPVKIAALELGLPVFQPVSLKSIEHQKPLLVTTSEQTAPFVDFLNKLPVLDAIVVVAYGKIIPSTLLSYPKHGILNIHPSLLPRWRGAAPLQHTIFNGDEKSGVCIMQLDEGLDTGPVFTTCEFALSEDETLGSLHEKCSSLGAKLLLESLPAIFSGTLEAASQEEAGATYAEKWEKEDLLIHWDEPVSVTLRRIRASSPVPGARTTFNDNLIKIYAAHAAPNKNYPEALPPGSVVEVNPEELIVAAGNGGYVSIDTLQFPGKKSLPVQEVLKGRTMSVGESFS